jgi:hypothetical protein
VDGGQPDSELCLVRCALNAASQILCFIRAKPPVLLEIMLFSVRRSIRTQTAPGYYPPSIPLPASLVSPPQLPTYQPACLPSTWARHHKQVTHSERVPIAMPSHPPFGSDSLKGSWLGTDSVHLLMAPWHPRLSAGLAYILSVSLSLCLFVPPNEKRS